MTAKSAASAVLAAIAVAICAAEVAGIPTGGVPGFGTTLSAPCEETVATLASLVPNQGVRVGDVVELDRMDRATRVAYRYGLAEGRTIALPIRRGSTHLVVPLTYKHPGLLATELWIQTAAQFAFLSAGLILLWRGREAAAFGLGVFFTGLAPSLGGPLSLLQAGVAAAVALTIASLQLLSFSGLFTMAYALSKNVVSDRFVNAARAIFWASLGMAAVASFAVIAPDLTGGCTLPVLQTITVACGVAFVSTTLVLLGKATFTAAGTRRIQLRWMYWSLSIGLFGPLVNTIYFGLNKAVPFDGTLGLTVLLVPIGSAYAILRHRVIDVSFVLNRALVYGAMTTIIVGILAVAESFIERAALSRSASLVLELAVPLALGVSFNPLHKWIDAAVDRVFFRRKHQAETALNLLAHESAFIERPADLLDRTADDVFRYSGGTSCSIYEREGEAYRLTRSRGDGVAPTRIDVDDPAFVRLRASQRDVDLDEVRSAAGARGLAVPMVVRGQLIGSIVCGPRTGDEPYAPDERALLRLVAREVAAALNAMQAKEHAELVGALATGLIDAAAARDRAKQLRALT